MQNFELKDIYERIIEPEANILLIDNPGLFLLPTAFDVLFAEYSVLYNYYSQKFMSKESEGIDYHKEISLVVIALLKAKIIKTVDESYYYGLKERHAYNEELSFICGCKILQTIISENYNTDNTISNEEREFCKKEIQKTLLLPKTTYASYQRNVITEFFFTSREGCFNFLALADKFFWIEYFNKRQIKERYKKKTSKSQEKTKHNS